MGTLLPLWLMSDLLVTCRFLEVFITFSKALQTMYLIRFEPMLLSYLVFFVFLHVDTSWINGNMN